MDSMLLINYYISWLIWDVIKILFDYNCSYKM